MHDDLSQALSQISEIHRQMARGQVFRGYRAATTAFTGLVAVAAAVAQRLLAPQPMKDVSTYLAVWLVAAVLSLIVVAAELIMRCRRLHSSLQTERTLEAAEKFLPCLAAGSLLTLVLYRFAWHSLWMLPGLWAILFSLGIFASRTLLPRGITFAAGFYMLAGMFNLTWAQGPHEMTPWAMGVTFGVGQLFTAGVLYWNLERRERPRHAR